MCDKQSNSCTTEILFERFYLNFHQNYDATTWIVGVLFANSPYFTLDHGFESINLTKQSFIEFEMNVHLESSMQLQRPAVRHLTENKKQILST